MIDEANFRARIRAYREAFLAAAPGASISYASKANSALALLAIAYQEGCDIDVASEGELRAALRAGVPASRCHLHGNNKSIEEIEFALAEKIGLIMVDNFEEIETLGALAPGQAVALRLAPGVDPVTHHKISTGQADTKFGFNIADGSAERALLRALEVRLNVEGFHCHVGSQLLDPEAQISGGEILAEFAARMKREHFYEAKLINVGGGLGVRYTDLDEPMAIGDYCQKIAEATLAPLRAAGISAKLAQEPGRSLIAEAGVTLYRVGVIKDVPIPAGTRRYIAVDGGLSDNPRPVMYDSKYTVEAIGAEGPVRKATVSGKHCETDRLFADVDLPDGLRVGDLIQVLCTGAYNSAMASNYNRFRRPSCALIRESGKVELIQRRDDWDELFARERLPEDLR